MGRLVCVCGGRERGEALASKYGTDYVPTFSDVDPTTLDAVLICTGTNSHSELIAAAAQAQLSIFCEKPIGATGELVDSSFRICAEKQVLLCCSFQRRFDQTYQAARAAVAEGKIGTPTFVRVFFGDHPCPSIEFLKNGGCPFMDLAPHDVDFVRWCIGSDPVEIHGTGSSSDPVLAEEDILDSAMITIKFENGCLCNIFMSRSATYGYDQRCEIFGTKGMISIENERETGCTFSAGTGIVASKYKNSFPQRFREAFENELNHFIQVVRSPNSSWKEKQAMWPITKEDCIAAQRISSTAAHSAMYGKILQYNANSENFNFYSQSSQSNYDENGKKSVVIRVGSANSLSDDTISCNSQN